MLKLLSKSQHFLSVDKEDNVLSAALLRRSHKLAKTMSMIEISVIFHVE